MEASKTTELYQRYKNALKGAEQGQVVTRFPPEPSGFLHIGHIKAAMLNFHYSKIYNGRMILRFDDTNPSKQSEDFADNIREDLTRLQIYPDHISHTSDWFQQISGLMRQMLQQGDAYFDNTPKQTMQNQRTQGVQSESRNWTTEQNLAKWEPFLAGQLTDFCIRGKIDMQNKNKCLRDPVFYRFNSTPHWRTKTEWKVYPTYDFACPIVDSLEGITHCLRTSQYNDRNPMYHWVIQRLGLRPVTICDFSKLNFVNTLLSKRKLQKLVDTGKVDGWFDPRFPTVQGTLRKGLTAEALKEFMLEQGHSKRTVFMDWTKIWSINKKVIDPTAPRCTAITADNICLLILTNGPQEVYQELHPIHPQNQHIGYVTYKYSNRVIIELGDAENLTVGSKATLIRWGNFLVESVTEGSEEDFNGCPIRKVVIGSLVLEDKDYKNTSKINWLPAVPELVSELKLVEFDVLITKAKEEEKDQIEDLFNNESKFQTRAFGSHNIVEYSESTVIQLERRGYFRVDVAGQQPVLFFVPDGRSKGVSILENKVDPKKLAKGSNQEPSARQKARAEKKAKRAAAKEAHFKAQEGNESQNNQILN